MKIRGITLVELVLATALSTVVMAMIWQGLKYFQNTLGQQARLERTSQALILTQEIAQDVRSAHRVIAAEPDHLDLEVYDFAHFGILDPALYENMKVIRYAVRLREEKPCVVREVFASTAAVKPDSSAVFLDKAELLEPTPETPAFFASYLVGGATVAVRVAFGLHPPFSSDRWEPVVQEAYVEAW
jgi:hypothetical protein